MKVTAGHLRRGQAGHLRRGQRQVRTWYGRCESSGDSEGSVTVKIVKAVEVAWRLAGETSLAEVMSCRVCRWFVVQQTGPLWHLCRNVRCHPHSFRIPTFFHFGQHGISQLSTSKYRAVVQQSKSHKHPFQSQITWFSQLAVMGIRRGWRRGVAASESRSPGVKCSCSCSPTHPQDE